MHRDFWQGQRDSPKKNAGRRGPEISIDNDTALILGLIFLLNTEKTDYVLLLALLYILA